MSPVQIQLPLPVYKVSLKYLGTGCNSGRWVACCFSEILYSIRPVGQAVKTRPFHGCNMGSIPVRVTKTSCSQGSRMFFFVSMWFGPTYGNRTARARRPLRRAKRLLRSLFRAREIPVGSAAETILPGNPRTGRRGRFPIQVTQQTQSGPCAGWQRVRIGCLF